MHSDFEEEMRIRIKSLKDNRYIETSRQCERICKSFNQYATNRQLFDNDVEDLYSTFKLEYLNRTSPGNCELGERYFEIVKQLVENAIQKLLENALQYDPKRIFDELSLFLPQITSTSIATKKIDEVFSKIKEKFVEIRTYGLMFIFMLHLEGTYFPIMKTLYALKLAAERKEIDFEILKKKSISSMKEELGDFGKPLFLTYDSVGRNLRNAIAHSNFKFEDGKLICWNIDTKTKIETWRKTFSYSELAVTMADIFNLSHLYVHWFILREIVFQTTFRLMQITP